VEEKASKNSQNRQKSGKHITNGEKHDGFYIIAPFNPFVLAARENMILTQLPSHFVP